MFKTKFYVHLQCPKMLLDLALKNKTKGFANC